MFQTYLRNWLDEVERMDGFEHMRVSCELYRQKCIFMVVHRPLSTNPITFIDEFELYLESVNTVSAILFAAGDFNL